MIYLYDIMRAKLGVAGVDWTSQLCTASVMPDTYIPNYVTDTNVSAFGPRYADVAVVRKLVAPTGWWTCDQIIFPAAVFPGPTSQAVVWRTSDGLPLFLCQFPVLPPSDVSRPFALLFSLSKPGILRP